MAKNQDYFEKLQRFPAMFTGEETLRSIHHFLSGYHFAFGQSGLSSEDDAFVLPDDFNDWVAYRLGFYESTSGWCRMICERTESERDAIDRFFALVSEHQLRKPHLVAQLAGLKKKYYVASTERRNGKRHIGELQTRHYPDSISLVTYTSNNGFFAYSDTDESFPSEGYFPDLESFELNTGADRTMLTIIDSDWQPKPFRDA